MKHLILLINFCLIILGVKAQSTDYKAFLISIEKKSNRSVHKFEMDYWIIPKGKIDGDIQKWILPFFIDGYSETDLIECCQENSLTLFNYSKEDVFKIDENYKDLINIINNHRKKIQVIKKKWTNGTTENIKVYVTPIKGKFCICNILDGKDKTNSKIGYKGNVIIPVSDFSYEPEIWSNHLSQQITKFDYDKLPFLQLHLIQ